MNQPFDPYGVPPLPPEQHQPQPYQPQTYPTQPYQSQPYQPQPYQPQPVGFGPPPPYGYPSQPASPYGYPPQLTPYGQALPLSATFEAGERDRKRKILIGVGIAVGALVLILAVVGAVVAARPTPPKRIALPAQVGAYSKLDNTASRTVESSIRSSVRSNPVAGAIFDAASIGVYSDNTGDNPALITVALPTSGLPTVARSAPETLVSELLSQAVTPGSATEVSSGIHGGDEQCATATFGVAHETVCAWSDAKTTGMLVSVEQPPVSSLALGAVAETFRDQID